MQLYYTFTYSVFRSSFLPSLLPFHICPFPLTQTLAIMPQIMMGRLPELFPQPERFMPERWSKENTTPPHPFSQLPFGFGPRMCPGIYSVREYHGHVIGFFFCTFLAESPWFMQFSSHEVYISCLQQLYTPVPSNWYHPLQVVASLTWQRMLVLLTSWRTFG